MAAAGCRQLQGEGVEGSGEDDRFAAEPDPHLAVCDRDMAEGQAD
jgi:hypothetical protein